MSGLLFLNDVLEDMSVEREPKFSHSSGAEEELGGFTSARKTADWDTELIVGTRGSCQGVGVRNLDDRYDKSCTLVRVRVLGVDKTGNLATGTKFFLQFRTHEQTRDVNILTVLSN